MNGTVFPHSYDAYDDRCLVSIHKTHEPPVVSRSVLLSVIQAVIVNVNANVTNKPRPARP
jgi:hypothetical protein